MRQKFKTKLETGDGNYYVDIERDCDTSVTREGDPNDRWDGDDLYHEHTIKGYRIVTKAQIGDFTLTEKPEGPWYLVYVLFSTGDSFHCEENCINLVSFVKNKEDAEEIKRGIEEDYKHYVKTHQHDYKPLKILLPKTNRVIDIYTGTWKGYFERFNLVDIECLTPYEKES